MSFSSDTKKELCTIVDLDDKTMYSELYAMLIMSKHFYEDKIVFLTENKNTYNRFIFLIKNLFNIKLNTKTPFDDESKKSRSYIVSVANKSDCSKIFNYYGHDKREISLRINRANIEDDEGVRAFIRGAFLACGSVSDPNKSYHLEFLVSYKNLCTDLCYILREIEECNISIKVISRLGSYVAYIKDSEQITDLLTYVGATNCAMNIMGAKALKQVRNSANRLTNSEIANLQKVADASAAQIKAIQILKENGKFNALPEELKKVAELRLKYPEMSLRDLGENVNPKLSRSGINHRLEKIIKISKEV